MRLRPVRTRYDRAPEIPLGILLSHLPAGEEPELQERPCTVARGATAEIYCLLIAVLRRGCVAQPVFHLAQRGPGFDGARIALNCMLERFLGIRKFLEFVKRAPIEIVQLPIIRSEEHTS